MTESGSHSCLCLSTSVAGPQIERVERPDRQRKVFLMPRHACNLHSKYIICAV